MVMARNCNLEMLDMNSSRINAMYHVTSITLLFIALNNALP